MKLSRALLKRSVRDRQLVGLDKWECPICKRVFPLNYPGDLHEWFYKKSSGKSQNILDDPRNCVLLCRECHEKYGQTEEGKRRIHEYIKGVFDVDFLDDFLLK